MTAGGTFYVSPAVFLSCSVNGVVQKLNFIQIACDHGVRDAVLQMILQNNAGGAIQGGSDGGELHQYLGTVAALLHHAFDGLQMPDGAGKPVHHGFALGVNMTVFAVVVLTLEMLGEIIPGLLLMTVEYSVSMIVIVKILIVRQVHIAHLVFYSI